MAEEDKSNMIILGVVVAVAVIGLIVLFMGQKGASVAGKGIETSETEDDYEEPVDILDEEGNVVGQAVGVGTKSSGGKKARTAEYVCSDGNGGRFDTDFCASITELKNRARSECSSRVWCSRNDIMFEYSCPKGYKKASWTCGKYIADLGYMENSPEISYGGQGSACKSPDYWYTLSFKKCTSWCPKVNLFRFAVSNLC